MADNNYQQNRVSTTGVTLFDENSTMLKLSYLDDTFSLSIAYPSTDANGKHSYPESARNGFLITIDRGAALYDTVICKDLQKALQEGNDFCEGIFLNRAKTSVFQIRIQDGEIYGVYCKNINEDKIAESSFVFHFQKTDLIEGYEPDTGNFIDKGGKVEGSFVVFTKYLEAGLNGMTNGIAHGDRKANQYSNRSVFEYLRAIAARLGVTVGNNNYYQKPQQNMPQDTSGFMNIPDSSAEELPFSIPEDSGPMESTSGSMEDFLS